MFPLLPKQFKVNSYVALRRLLSSPYTYSGNVDNPDALLQQINKVKCKL